MLHEMFLFAIMKIFDDNDAATGVNEQTWIGTIVTDLNILTFWFIV